jgi:alpha-acetolactate decarboxylase
MKYEFTGNTKFVIVNGKAYHVKSAKDKKIVEIPDDIEVKEKFLKPLEVKKDKKANVQEKTEKEGDKK